MAASHDMDTTQYLIGTAGTVTAYPAYLSMWAKINTVPGSLTDSMASYTEAGNGGLKIYIHNTGGIRVRFKQTSQVYISAGSDIGTGWNHILIVTRSATDHEIYVNGSSYKTDSTNIGTWIYDYAKIVIGDEENSDPCDGKFAYVQCGSASIDDNLALEMYNNVMFMPSGCTGFWPLLEDATAVSDFKDISGQASALSSGTLGTNDLDGPKVFML